MECEKKAPLLKGFKLSSSIKFLRNQLSMSGMKRTKVYYLGNFGLIKSPVLEPFKKVKLIYQSLSANFFKRSASWM